MTKEIISFLKPRLALLLAAAMLISMMPVSAFAAETTVPETTWESQVTGSFIEAASDLESYTHYSVVDGEAVPETVTIDTTATLGSKENPIAISSPEELILFGQAAAGGYAATSNPTYGKYYILTQDTYDMGAHSMLALSASVYYPSGGVSYFGFYGTLIGNGATIRNANIVDGTRAMNHSNVKIQPALFSALNGRIWDLTLDSCTVSGGSGTMGMLYAATNGLGPDAIINCNIIDGQILPGSGISTISLLGSTAVNSQADVTLGCDYTLRSNLTLNSGETLTIPEGVTLTVPARRTLTLGSGTSLINNGKLLLAEGGSIVNNGGTATCGENSGHAYLEGVCQICGNGCPHTGDATCAEQVTCTLCGQVYQPAHTPNEAGDACDVCGVAMYRVSKYEEDDRLRFLLFQGPDYAFEGQDYVGRIIVDPDYGVTESTDFNFEVWVDGVQITEYRFCNTVLTVPAHLVTGDILITCDGDLQKEPDTPLGSCPGIVGGSLSHDGFDWAADYSSCTIRACCGLCDEIFEYTHTPGVATTEATCAQTGKTVYSVSFRDLSDSKEMVLPIDESNHDYVDSVCSRCGEKLYPIFLGGVQISDDNASDILGDGTASYDAQTGTLTLNGTTVDASTLSVPALEITGGTVTLALQGTNALTGSVQVQSATDEEGNTTWYGEPAISITEGAALIITGDEAATLTLMGNDFAYTANDHIPGASSISGGSLTVAGGTITTNNGIRLTGDYSQTGGSVDAGFLEAQNVTVSDGILNARGYSGIEPRYLDPSAGGIHGIFARETITVSGGTVTSFSGVVGHNGDYRGAHQVTGETITTHGLYALESISITGGSVTSTGCQGGYVIGDMGELTMGNYGEGEELGGPAPGAALEAPEWSISAEATFICGSDASHRDGIATCVNPLACQFCGVVRGELDAGNHAGPYTVQYKWYPHTDGTCYVYAELYCDGCGEYVDDTSDYAELIEDVAPVNCQNPGSRTWSFTCTFNGEQYSEIHTETIYNDVHIVFDGNGFCTSCGGYQKPTVDPGEDAEWDYDDVYLIYNAGQLYWFADYVNNVNNNVTGKLMTDIDLNPGYTFHGDGTYTGGDSPRMWIPIGTGYPCYAGSFNGNGFAVSGAYAVSEGSYVGLFGNTDYNYTIENLGIANSYFKGADHVGGLIGYAYTTVKNCYVTNTVYVSGDYDTAAFIGYSGGEITNCYAMADTFVASNYGSCYNCYAMTEGDGTTALTAEDFISGKAAYLLQSGVAEGGYYDENDNWVTFIPEIWGQSIGTDSYPVLKGAKVYQVTNCKNETVYSNTDENIEHIPVGDDGDCTTPVNCSVCGDVLIAAKADHDLSYTNNGDDHSYTCSNCNVAATEAHSYTNFLCACGMVSPDAVATVVSGDGAMYFATFADALSAWTDGTTLQLLQNVEYAEMITVTGKRVLDLNGKVIHCQCSDSNMGFNLFNIEGDLTIRDSGENGTITLRGTNYARVITSVGNLTIEGGHIDGQHFGINCEGGTLNISGGTVSANYAVDLVNTEATVSNGKIQGDHIAVDIAGGVSLVVTGGEISASGVAIQVGQDAKSAVISGGSLSATGYGVECYGNVTISGNVAIDAELADFCFSKAFPDARLIIDCPLADGNYTVKMDVPGAFGVAGEGITLNPKAFTAYNTNHKIVEDDAGLSMVLCDHSNGIDADGACLDCGKISQFNILVDGVIITTANMSDVLGDGTVSYDSATNTLILNNAKIEDAVYADGDASMGLGILAEQDLNIRLVGDNFISSGASEYMSVAILCYGNLTITGNGTLIAQCGQAQEMLSIAAIESFTVDANVSVTVSDFVQCGSYSIPGQFNGILKVGFGPYDYVACGNAVLSGDLTVNGNNDTATMEHIGEFTVMEGATLTIADGVTLTIADNSELASTEVNNIFTNKGKVILEGSGTIVNLGEGICTETATHCFDSESKCLICGYTCPHSWLDATCTAPKTCTVCGETEGEALGHTEKTVPGYDATCTKSGLTDGVICSVCGEILTAQTAIPTTAHSWVTACTKPKTCSVCGETQGPVLPHNGYDYDGVCDYCGVIAVRVKLEDTGTEYFAFAEAGEDLVISVPESEYQLYCWVEDTRTGIGLAEGFVNQDGTFTVSGAYLDGSRAVCVEVDPVYVGIVNLNGGSIIDENKEALEAAGLKCTETYHERVYYIRYSASTLYPGMYIREGYTLVGYELDGVVYGIKDPFTVSGDNFIIDLIWECDHQWKDATCTAPKTCTVCGETEGEALGHSYENNVCTVCGQENVPVKLDSASLSFKEKIHYNIFFSLGLDENVDLSDMGLVMFDSLNADGTVDDAIAIYSGAVEVDGKYMIATDGVHAKRMGDTIYFRVYAKLADGSYVYSKTVQYSAVTYAEHILAGDQPESAKALVVAMLNYGAAAQKFFGYNTDNLVNAFLTEEQKALPEQYRDDMVSTVPVVAAEKQGIFANNKGFSKRVPAVSFEGAFEINYFFTPAYAPVDGITLYYWTEVDFNANDILTADNATGSIRLEGTGTEQYRGDISGIAAKNLSENIYVAAVYSDGTTTWTSGVLGYSIGAYCGRLAAKGGAMADLAMATAVYGYHAKQYFG